MFQRDTIPPAATAAPDLAARWRKTLLGSWPRLFSPSSFLPHSLRSFLFYMLGLAGISIGISLHLFLSAQIMTAKVQLENLTREYQYIDQQNMEIIWQTSRLTAFTNVQARAVNLGYEAIPKKVYRLRRSAQTPALGISGKSPAADASEIPATGIDDAADRPTETDLPANGLSPGQRIRRYWDSLGSRQQGWIEAINAQLAPLKP